MLKNILFAKFLLPILCITACSIDSDKTSDSGSKPIQSEGSVEKNSGVHTASWKLLDSFERTMPGADEPFSYSNSVPIGWGYHAPQVIVTSDQGVFLSAFYPCSLLDKKVYCMQVLRNGQDFGPRLNLSAFGGVDRAYQPPSLFRAENEIIAVYWGHATATGESSTFVVSLPLSGNSGNWTLKEKLTQPGSYNYLGASMGPGSDIVVSGFALDTSGNHSLKLARLAAPYNNWNYVWSPLNYATMASPLYTHVIVEETGVALLTTLEPPGKCANTGRDYTMYNNVASYDIRYSGEVATVWSESIGPDWLQNLCDHGRSRFGLDAVKLDGVNYYLYRLTQSGEKRIVLRTDERMISSDIGEHFGDLFGERGILSATLTKSGDTWYIVANNDETGAVVASRDFEEFSPPYRFQTPHGVGNSVKVYQPGRNGGDSSQGVHLWFGGSLIDYSSADSLRSRNDFLRFRYVHLQFDW